MPPKSACSQARVLSGVVAFFLWFSVAAVFHPPHAQASLEQNASSPKFLVRAPSKLLQGIVNLGFGWSAFFIEPVQSIRDPEDRFVDGFFRGLAYPISYSFLGAWDIGTFWVPGPGELPMDMSQVHDNVLNL